MEDSVKSLTEVQKTVFTALHSSRLGILLQMTTGLGREWLSHDKSILTAPDGFPLLNMPRYCFQNWLLHHLPRDWDEADWTVVPLVVFLLLIEDRSNICFPLVCRHLPQLCQCSWLHPIMRWSSSTKRYFFLVPDFQPGLWDLRFLKGSFAGKDWAKTLSFSLSHVTWSFFSLWRGHNFPQYSFCHWGTYRSPSHCSCPD